MNGPLALIVFLFNQSYTILLGLKYLLGLLKFTILNVLKKFNENIVNFTVTTAHNINIKLLKYMYMNFEILKMYV